MRQFLPNGLSFISYLFVITSLPLLFHSLSRAVPKKKIELCFESFCWYTIYDFIFKCKDHKEEIKEKDLEKELEENTSAMNGRGDGTVNNFFLMSILCPLWLLPSRLKRLTPRNKHESYRKSLLKIVGLCLYSSPLQINSFWTWR